MNDRLAEIAEGEGIPLAATWSAPPSRAPTASAYSGSIPCRTSTGARATAQAIMATLSSAGANAATPNRLRVCSAPATAADATTTDS